MIVSSALVCEALVHVDLIPVYSLVSMPRNTWSVRTGANQEKIIVLQQGNMRRNQLRTDVVTLMLSITFGGVKLFAM